MIIDLEEKIYMIKLFDEYKNLLTKTQSKYLSYYYFDDYSLREISEIFSVSRNAVHDAITKSEKILKKYEEALGNVSYKEKISKVFNDINAKDSIDEVKKIVSELNIKK